MNFTDLLQRESIDPKQVIVARHAELLKVLPSFAAEKPDVFNAYQQCQSLPLELALKGLHNKGYLASFLAHGPGKAIFVGLYAIGNSRPINEKQFWDVQGNKMLQVLGYKGFKSSPTRLTIEQFDLTLTDFRESWKGKLIVDWPGKERSWWRRAEKNNFSVHAVLEESAFAKSMPKWNDLDLSWAALKSWQSALREWGGIYYIQDRSDGKAYVGSASGRENLLGRWQNYAANGHGSNKLLKTRNPENFRFCILERVSPDMHQDEIVAKENSWKRRLGTRHPVGLNDN